VPPDVIGKDFQGSRIGIFQEGKIIGRGVNAQPRTPRSLLIPG
jgi:hypothetical protein